MKFRNSILLFALVSCSPSNNLQNGIALPHKDFVANFDGFASACFEPILETDKVICEEAATYAHFTLTFTQSIQIDSQIFKVQYKKRLLEKAEMTCFPSEIKPDSVRLFQSKDQKAVISDEDIENHDATIIQKATTKLKQKNDEIGEKCYHFTLVNGESPMTQYKVRMDETGVQNPKFIGFFSAGSPIYLTR